jgi:putative ABC transport system permease protein
MMLLTGAGLLIKSFVKLESVKPGFNPEGLLTMKVSVPGQYKEDHQIAGFYDEMLSRIESLPGAQSAGTVLSLPLTGLNDLSIGLTIDGHPAPSPDHQPSCQYRTVSPAYFTTMRIPLIAGRFFTDSDASGAPRVVIVNETMAKRYWPGEDPIGKHVSYGGFGPTVSPTVVGVVGDVKHGGLENDAEVEMYVPYRQNPRNSTALVVRANKNPMAMARVVESTIWSIDKDALVSEVAPMENVISDSIARPRFNTFLLSVFAGAALILAAVGIYGVVSYSVSQRTSEIGIKMALGAQASDVLKFTMGNALATSLAGIGAGLIGAAALTRMLKSLLFNLSTSDPAVFISIPLLLLAIVLISSYVPARRATRVDPIKALRVE